MIGGSNRASRALGLALSHRGRGKMDAFQLSPRFFHDTGKLRANRDGRVRPSVTKNKLAAERWDEIRGLNHRPTSGQAAQTKRLLAVIIINQLQMSSGLGSTDRTR